jgi:hypothetical protein
LAIQKLFYHLCGGGSNEHWTAMEITEIIHSFQKIPNLVIVQGQFSIALSGLRNMTSESPLINMLLQSLLVKVPSVEVMGSLNHTIHCQSPPPPGAGAVDLKSHLKNFVKHFMASII